MRLAIHQNGRFLRAVSLEKDALRVGRLSSCDLVLEGQGVARYHAFIERSVDGHWTLVGMGPSGTRVNGAEITRTRIGIGDEIAIGSYTIVLMDETATALPTLKPALAPALRPALRKLPPPLPPPDPKPELMVVEVAEDTPALWAASAEELSAEPPTGEVVIPLELTKPPEEPIFLLTHRKHPDARAPDGPSPDGSAPRHLTRFRPRGRALARAASSAAE